MANKDKKGAPDSDGKEKKTSGDNDGKDKEKKTPKTAKDKKGGKGSAIQPEVKTSILGPKQTPPPPQTATVPTPKSGEKRGPSQSLKPGDDNNPDPKLTPILNPQEGSSRNLRYSASMRFIGTPLEWNSHTVKEEELFTEGYTCCVVLIAEESSELSEYADYLFQAVNTGARKRFIALKGEDVASKVYQYMTSAQMREPGEDEDIHLERMDLWAEVIKDRLIANKASMDTETQLKTKENDNLGARSKDILQHVPTLNAGNSIPKGLSDEDMQETAAAAAVDTKIETVPLKETKKTTKEKKEIKNNPVQEKPGTGISALKKRGEIPMPFLEQIDDVPVNGSKCYLILQGFYNPRIIPELKKIGVPVNGILLLTNNDKEKKNFSVYDIEENIAGTFIPRNVLPDYVNIIQRRNSNAFKRQNNAIITQFWMELAALINNAPLQSCLHDIALLNCPLPKPEIELDSPEGRGLFATQIFDEAAQRIYEMHVLLDWFQEYRQAVFVRQITPIEVDIPHAMYERVIRQVPAECVTIPIIMECIVEQVLENVGVDRSKEAADEKPKIDLFSDNQNINLGPEWGLTAYPKVDRGNLDSSRSTFEDISLTSSKKYTIKPVFQQPKFIRSGDYASMRTAHLSDEFGSHLASSQVTGDFHRLESILWQDLPEFNKGLYMKLLGNLNHFMYFLPPDTIRLDDMFFILHLLMTAGVETHLQKLAQIKKEAEQRAAAKRTLPIPLSLLINTHGPGSDVHYIPGTQLLSDHNYLTINQEDALHFILAPNGENEDEMTVSQLGQTKVFVDTPEEQSGDNDEEYSDEEDESEGVEIDDENPTSPTRRKSSYQVPEATDGTPGTNEDQKSDRKISSNAGGSDVRKRSEESAGEVEDIVQERLEKSSLGISSNRNEEEEIMGEQEYEPVYRPLKGGGVAAAAPVVEKENPPEQPTQLTPPNTGNQEQPPQLGGFGVPGQKAKRFISCDDDHYKDINDYSTFKTLLECPALLTMGSNGALDLSKWVETYLDCKGLTTATGEGMMIGQLKDWNYVEEYLPIQMIQVLSEAIGSYLSLQRMYCPFFDTVLFIFNNPTPFSLQSDSNFVSKIQTLPGLQHFLEYTINDEEVLHWIMQLEQKKGVEVVDSFSADTLMKIVPEDQWVLAPSIKERILRHKLAKERKAEEEEHVKIEKNYMRVKVESKKKADEKDIKRKQSKVGVDDKKKKSVAAINLEETISEDKKRKYSKKSKQSKIDTKKTSKTEEDKKEKDRKNSKAFEKDTNGSKVSKKGEDNDSKKERKGSKDEDTIPSADAKSDSNKDKTSVKSRKPSFNFTDAIKISKGLKPPREKKKKLFHCYDLGKRMIITAIDTYHMFPLDGSIIQYEIATIEPDYRMMQLSITKNGHQSFFYPYYIPHDLNLSSESYVVCPYFHMVHSNGTIFAFQDQRAREAAPYIRYCLKTRTQTKKFNYEKIVFNDDYVERKKREIKNKKKKTSNQTEQQLSAEAPQDDPAKRSLSPDGLILTLSESQDLEAEEDIPTSAEDMEGEHADETLEIRKDLSEDENSDKGSKGKKLKKEKDKDKEKAKAKEKLDKKKQPKDLKGAPAPIFGGKDPTNPKHLPGHQKNENAHKPSNNHEGSKEAEPEIVIPQPEIVNFPEDLTGEWIYPASENSDVEEDVDGPKRKKSFYSHTWENAEKILSPLVHSFKVTLPSGLVISCTDVHGPPLNREVKQWYVDKGSAASLIESSRYYTSNGSVVKFMLNSTIQVINARGVTTTIREVSANVNREKNNIRRIFSKATAVKVYEGDVILPTGEYWKITKGVKTYHDPLFLFCGGQLPGGETFRRRQDGVIYLHRHDGTVICHYPDGTRFTTRMVIMKDAVEEFDDWVFVGMKTMVEHPNYATILFNSLSGNVHLKLPQGEWVRIFADGSIKVGTEDDYTLDVDSNRAVLSFPACSAGNCGEKKIPNVTAVKLFHTPVTVDESSSTMPNEDELLKEIPITDSYANEEEDGEDAQLGKEESTHGMENPNDVSGNTQSKTGIVDNQENSRKESTESDHLNRKRSNRSVSIGESIGEAEDGGENSNPANAEGVHYDSILERQRRQRETQAKAEQIRLEVEEFLKFTDTWTFCKSIDSWDNKFAITVFGEKTVNKSNRFQKEMCVSTESLLNSFSRTHQASQPFIGGILPTTSSENLITLTKRISAFRQAKIGDCGKLPKTKIFVVKRDLSGYQFLKHADVDSVLRKVRSHRESVVVTDALPNVPPRKYITIMEPVNNSDKPNGMWHSKYREPIFRPKIMNNKQLNIARPEDLRWFGYVLSTAHGKRPRFVQEPKERYLANKAMALAKKSLVVESPQPSQPSQESSSNPNSQEEQRETHRKHSHGMAEVEIDESVKENVADGTEHAGDNLTSEGTDESDKTKQKKEKELSRKSRDAKKEKRKKKDEPIKHSSVKVGKKNHSIDKSAGEKVDEIPEIPEDNPQLTNQSKVEPKKDFFGVEAGYGTYPDDVLDVEGIYDVDTEVKPKISSQEHADLCTRHKSIVVRNFMEIPQIDENLQGTLIAASKCYGKAIENQMGIYKTFEMDDPLYEDERKRQKFIKQQLIEQNLEDMHLYEQAQGKVLSFHF